MKVEDAIKKYGAENYKKMGEFMGIHTVSVDKDGQIDIPERDLELAYKQLSGYKPHWTEWD